MVQQCSLRVCGIRIAKDGNPASQILSLFPLLEVDVCMGSNGVPLDDLPFFLLQRKQTLRRTVQRFSFGFRLYRLNFHVFLFRTQLTHFPSRFRCHKTLTPIMLMAPLLQPPLIPAKKAGD